MFTINYIQMHPHTECHYIKILVLCRCAVWNWDFWGAGQD